MARNSRNSSSTRRSREQSATRADRPRQEAPDSATPTLNEKLRKKGKWIFAALAAVFALTFVIAGVGTGGPSMLDLLEQERIAEVQETVAEDEALKQAQAAADASPDDPSLWLDLAQAQVNAGNEAEAIAAADKAVELAPDDAAVQSRAADVYLAEASAALQEAQELYAEAQASATGGQRPVVPLAVVPGQTSGSNAFRTASETLSSARLQAAFEEVTPLQETADTAYGKALTAQERVVELQPDDAAAWFKLGQVATAANDVQRAIDAYRRFVEIAPDDPLVTQVNEEIERLDEILNPPVETTAEATAE